MEQRQLWATRRRKQKQVGDVVTQFVSGGGQEIADNHCSDEICTPWMLTVRGPGGLPVAAITPATDSQPESVAFYHHDILGSTTAATQLGTDGPAEVYAYSDYGEPAGGSFLPYRFAGNRYDEETGLYFVQARYYSPEMGRFVQPDPVGTLGGPNLYAYVGNDPLNLTDPLGLFDWIRAAGALRALGGALEAVSGAGLALGTGGLAAAPGVLVTAHGVDQTIAGLKQLISGNKTDSLTSQGLQAAGMSQSAANLTDTAIGIVGSAGTGIATGMGKVATVKATDSLAEGLSTTEILSRIDTGSQALADADYIALGGNTTSALAKANMIENGVDAFGNPYQLTTTSLQEFTKSLSLAGTGLTPSADIGAGVLGSSLQGAASVAPNK